MSSHIVIDYDKCCGAGNCVRQAPDIFDQDDDGIVMLIKDHLTDRVEDARAAADVCPTWAIRVEDGTDRGSGIG